MAPSSENPGRFRLPDVPMLAWTTVAQELPWLTAAVDTSLTLG